MTEDEAKTKWCPFVRPTPETEYEHASSNRPTNFDTVCCIGSVCMAWRDFSSDHYIKLGITPPKDLGGYCGLAGKP